MSELLDIAEEHWEEASDAEEKERYTSAVKLYANALYAILDNYFYEQKGERVSNHAERKAFAATVSRTLLEHYRNVYLQYRKSYKRRRTKDDLEEVKDAIRHIFSSIDIEKDSPFSFA